MSYESALQKALIADNDRLRIKNAKLRAALEQISKCFTADNNVAACIARAALAKEQEGK
jgi:hypothetical protein